MKRSLCVLVCLALAGCGKEMDFDQMEESNLFESFTYFMQNQKFSDAVSAGQTMLKSYPASEHVKAVKLGMVSAYVQTREYDVAVLLADRLIDSQMFSHGDLEGIYYERIIAKTRWSSHWIATRLEWLVGNDKFRNTQVLLELLDEIEYFSASYSASEHLEELSSIHEQVETHLIQQEEEIAKFYADQGDDQASQNRLARMKDMYAGAKV
ncbi:outer membrane protein assembly factor BamD [Gammaproteobacteria bacterium]|nr:outer membrane protein assembly factor BamD [Gammaproteobacteria bacterium]